MTKQTHFYLRDRKGHPIGVVAMRKEDDGVRVAASLCATTDEWDKHVGVAKAVGRLESARQSSLRDDGPGVDNVGNVLNRLLGPKVTPENHDWPWCDRLLADVDLVRAQTTYDAQYERLTTPRPA